MPFKADRYSRIVIVGGGAIGTSIAYHLARAGEKDVLLLEKSLVTHGCTWHAAGLVGQLRGKRNLTRLMQNSVAVFDRLEEEADAKIDWKKVGSLRLASSPDRWSEIRRSMSQARSFGVECAALSAAEAAAKFPFIRREGIEGAAFIPGDGYIDPYALTQAYVKAARKFGARIEEGVTVREIAISNRRAVGVITDGGNIGCEILVNCAGLWAKRVGEMAGVALAAGVVEHQYFLTEKTLDFPADLTTLRDPDNNFYLKPDTGAFAIGGWEEGTPSCWQGKPPLDFGRELFPPSMDRLERFAIPAASRLPVLNEVGIQSIINGPIPVSADGEPIMGLAPELDNFYVACGFTAGIAASGGAGEAMANWIVNGDPGMDLWAFDVRRFGRVQAQPQYLSQRAVEAYAAYYKIHWPGEEMKSARGLRRSPLYETLLRAGAVYGSKFGWERANWFAEPGQPAIEAPSFEGKPGWFDAVGREHRAIREACALIDQSSFSKFEITGPGALAALQRIAANDLGTQPGRAIYTQLCNAHGGIEADVTILYRGANDFLLVTGSGFGVRDRDWVARHLSGNGSPGDGSPGDGSPGDGIVVMRDVTSAFAVLNLCGPKSRELLAAVTDADISNDAFPFLAARQINLGNAEVFAVRVGYVGELGYELYLTPDYAGHVYDELMAAGREHGIVNAGYRAIESCRLEKGYLYWSGDIGPDNDPFQAGLGFAVALDKLDFNGRDALRRIAGEGVARRLSTFSIDGFAPLHGGEPILLGGSVVGSTASCGYGYTLGKTIAFGYLPVELAAEQMFQIEAFGQIFEARRGARCLYDAKMERLRA